MTAMIAEQASAYGKAKAAEKAKAAPGAIRQTRIPGGGNKYQGAILAEFLVAVLVVAFAPIAAGPRDDKGGPSPYRVGAWRSSLLSAWSTSCSLSGRAPARAGSRRGSGS